jgi:NDP-sugar pyrophosphorylase family protein
MRAVILAGGKGTRLKPFTTSLPKPLMPIGDAPILEIVLKQLKKYGFHDITLAVSHLSELIRAFFGDGSKWGTRITYSIEDTPLGTMGPLKLIADLPENFLVMNGDVLTDFNFGKFYESHLNDRAVLSVATIKREAPIDFGVLTTGEDWHITGFQEKPAYTFDVSMGIYALNRKAVEFIPEGVPFGFDQLVLALLKSGEPIRAYPHQGFWLDIGRPADYDKANTDYAYYATEV